MELCIGIQAALACLAILSRIHFSKYKDGDIKGLKHIREEVQALRVLTRREAAGLDNHCNPVCKYLYRGGTTV